jgi:uncharacterized membrane protein (DUF106 family)
MFVIDDRGKARKISDIEDIEKINKKTMRVFDDDGKMLARKMSKSALKAKFGGR